MNRSQLHDRLLYSIASHPELIGLDLEDVVNIKTKVQFDDCEADILFKTTEDITCVEVKSCDCDNCKTKAQQQLTTIRTHHDEDSFDAYGIFFNQEKSYYTIVKYY